MWIHSSLQMWQLGKAAGFDYYHFLQPNQWVSGSKTLSRWEETNATNLVSEYGKAAVAAYPALIEAGPRIAEAGAAYMDLTPIYRDVEQTLYIDNCCHVNALGSRIMARAIVERIAQGPS